MGVGLLPTQFQPSPPSAKVCAPPGSEPPSQFTIGLADGQTRWHQRECEDWTVHLMDTGTATNTGGRVKRLEPLLKDETFLLTYGDGYLCRCERCVVAHLHARRETSPASMNTPVRSRRTTDAGAPLGPTT